MLLKPFPLQSVALSIGKQNYLKKIVHTETENTVIVEGVQVKSPREGKVIKVQNNTRACPLCRLGLKNIRHTDVLILSQFINSDGTLLPKQITGLCGRQYRQVGIMVHHAQLAGLLPRKPHMPATEPWEHLNTYTTKK
ncbi:mitochondrial ribosomal protein S18A [Tachypleus tridentatus]|uniref:mitochondrial ribosomal protein S18A n=1 Tax=Tachypleus tridentatus TaxID=6853 RepID=UPI003FD5F763